MSTAEALRRCPQAIVVPPRHDLYAEYSGRVFAVLRSHVSAVEQLGLDEAYLDLSGHVSTSRGADRFLRNLQAAIWDSCSLTASFGCGRGKVIAKIASDLDKPGGVVVVAPGREAAVLGPLAVRLLPGIGPRSAERLRLIGIVTIGDLASASDESLDLILPGIVGRTLRDRARGLDPRPVVTDPGAAVQISVEETFAHDLVGRGEIDEELRRLVVDLTARLGTAARSARTVSVKVRYADFSIATRAESSSVGVRDALDIERLARRALDRVLEDRPPPIRLLGVAGSRFIEGEQLRLPFDWLCE